MTTTLQFVCEAQHCLRTVQGAPTPGDSFPAALARLRAAVAAQGWDIDPRTGIFCAAHRVTTQQPRVTVSLFGAARDRIDRAAASAAASLNTPAAQLILLAATDRPATHASYEASLTPPPGADREPYWPARTEYTWTTL